MKHHEHLTEKSLKENLINTINFLEEKYEKGRAAYILRIMWDKRLYYQRKALETWRENSKYLTQKQERIRKVKIPRYYLIRLAKPKTNKDYLKKLLEEVKLCTKCTRIKRIKGKFK